jgi:Uncharacterized protein conserved in bacteria (DUF2066)
MLRFHGSPALLCALALLCLLVRPALADGTFSVADVHVDGSAASASEARIAAIAGGRPVAWQRLYRRLTRQQDWARQPMLDDAQLQRMIVTYVPQHERRSTTRYVADVTFTFNPQAVAQVLQSAGIPYAATTAKRVLVIPMAPGYARGSLWTQAFASPRFANSLVPFSVPIGDAQDTAALQSLNFDLATWANVEPVASRLHATEAVLIKATVTGNTLAISLRRLGAGEMPTKTSTEVPILQGAPSTYPAAADAAVQAMGDLWKANAAVDFSQRGKLTADVHITSLAQFNAIENTLAGMPNISNVSIHAMDIGEARLTISYIGTPDQIRDAMAQAGLSLVGQGDTWQLSQGSPAGQP